MGFMDFTMEAILYFLVIVEWLIMIGLAGLAAYGVYRGVQALWRKMK